MSQDGIPITPTIEIGVAGPRREDGFVLRAPWHEALSWDIENEVVSARRQWMAEREVWWIDASYLRAVTEIVLRSFPSVLVRGINEDHLLSRDGVAAVQGRLL